MKVCKVNDLLGLELDYAFGLAEGQQNLCKRLGRVVATNGSTFTVMDSLRSASGIQVREKLSTGWNQLLDAWVCYTPDHKRRGYSPFLEEAIIRCHIANKLGDAVIFPEELPELS